MAAFQVMITPPAKKTVKVEKPLEYVTPKLTLAPFNPTPEISFGSVTINAKSTKPLIVFNPNPTSITVILKNIDTEDRIVSSDSTFQLDPREEKEIYISWSPIQSGYLRKTIRVQDATRKARSFDVILNGTCVSNKVTDKRKRLKDENTRPKQLGSQKSSMINQTQKQDFAVPLRRQTYSIEEKENRLPSNYNYFRTSSPKYQNLTTLNENFKLLDIAETPAKYSNFESELDFNSEISNLHSSNEADCRRGTYTLVSEKLKNPFTSSSIDEVDSLPGSVDFYDSLCKNVGTPSDKNANIEATDVPDNVFLTPLKNVSYLLSPTADYRDCFETPTLNVTRNLSNDSLSSKKNDFIEISPPLKSKNFKKSPDYVVPRRNVSSAISDRKKHLKTNILTRRKTPPSLLKKNRVIPCVEKIKTQDPSTLRQVLRSHIDDPFLRQSLYCDEHWIDRQERDIIKWMNSLLTPPIELESDWTVDAAEIWLKSRRDGELRTVPSIDNIAAAVYHSPQRLDTLRKTASALLSSEPVHSVFQKISIVTDKKIISVREDRDLHLDQALKNKLMQLLSCYNPLWLQIALEAVYSQKIVKQGKSDVGGLGWFIRKHVLVSAITNKKNAHPAVLQIKKPNYKDQVKKYILQKFLCIIYFLDQAKTRKLIRHNPCLFVMSSEYKSSQDLLLAFCGDLVVGRGDITKHLKAINYVLQYRQTCIDEYDYSIASLHDLKDGVRLNRLFEILFNEPDLCSKLRVPAISILQKIYNVSVAMKVAESKCKIEGDITAKEIVSGHREKILSFLWQIINNYLTPLYEKSAVKIQKWWRQRLLKICTRRMIENKTYRSAVIIQAAWRGYITRKKYQTMELNRIKCHRAANTIKKFFKCIVQRNKSRRENAAVIIQRRFRATMQMRRYRRLYEATRQKSVTIQRWWRCKLQRKRFLLLRSNIVSVQRRYRANRLMVRDRDRFLTLKKHVICVQRIFRANQQCRLVREHYASLKSAAICIQRRFRANRQMKLDRQSFVELRSHVVSMQLRFRANKAAKIDRAVYLATRTAVVTIQRRFRATKEMIRQRDDYIKLKSSVIRIQRRYRANKAAKLDRKRYVDLKQAVVLVQRRYRANKSMKDDRQRYLNLKNYCIIVQRRFRANRAMRRDRSNYRRLIKYAILTQTIFRAKQQMIIDRQQYKNLKKSVITVQRRFRANLDMKIQRKSYNELKKNVTLVQRRFRANRLMRQERRIFLKLKEATLIVQAKFRANQKMKNIRNEYLTLKKSAIFVQRHFRAKVSMKSIRQSYTSLKNTCIFVQRLFRANRATKLARKEFVEFKKAAITVQRKYRAVLETRKNRREFVNLKNKVILVQRLYRAKLAMRHERDKFLALKSAAMIIQRQYRAYTLMKSQRENFLVSKRAAVIIQTRYRTWKATRQFAKKIEALKTIQRWYRCRTCRRDYLKIRRAAITIQTRYKAWIISRRCRLEYIKLKYIVCLIQSRTIIAKRTEQLMDKYSLPRDSIRSDLKIPIRFAKSVDVMENQIDCLKITKRDRIKFLELKLVSIFVQKQYKGKLRRREERRAEILEAPEEKAAVKIQSLWRGYRVRKNKIPKRTPTTKKPNNDLDTKVTLGERYKKAIMQLKTSDMYDVIIRALWNLESVTMLSAKLCEGVVAEGVIPIIFNLMSRGNRSEPSLEIYRAGCSILVNLARYQPTKVFLWDSINKVDDLYLILHVMKITYDKSQAPVFRYAATLLWLLCQDESAARVVADLFTFQQQVEKMLETLKRKSLKNPQIKKNAKRLPKVEADWYPEGEDRVFDNNYVAIVAVHRVLFGRR